MSGPIYDPFQSDRHGAFGGGGNGAGILGQDPIFVARLGRFPLLEPFLDLGLGQFHLQQALVYIEDQAEIEEREAASWIPSRLTRGPLAPDLPKARLSDLEQSWYETSEAQSLDQYLLVNFIDGERTILDIRNALAGASQPVSVIAVHHFIQDLAKIQLIELHRVN